MGETGTVHTWGQCTRGDSAQQGTLHTWDSAHVGTVHTWGQYAHGYKEGKCHDGKYLKKGKRYEQNIP